MSPRKTESVTSGHALRQPGTASVANAGARHAVLSALAPSGSWRSLAYRSDAAPAPPTDPVKIEFAASRAGNAEWMVDAGAVRAGAIGVLRSLPHRSDVAPPPASAPRPRSNKTEI